MVPSVVPLGDLLKLEAFRSLGCNVEKDVKCEQLVFFFLRVFSLDVGNFS